MSLPISTSSVDPTFETRWAEWIALGARRDAATRRRFRVALPIALVLAAVAAYLLIR